MNGFNGYNGYTGYNRFNGYRGNNNAYMGFHPLANTAYNYLNDQYWP